MDQRDQEVRIELWAGGAVASITLTNMGYPPDVVHDIAQRMKELLDEAAVIGTSYQIIEQFDSTEIEETEEVE